MDRNPRPFIRSSEYKSQLERDACTTGSKVLSMCQFAISELQLVQAYRVFVNSVPQRRNCGASSILSNGHTGVKLNGDAWVPKLEAPVCINDKPLVMELYTTNGRNFLSTKAGKVSSSRTCKNPSISRQVNTLPIVGAFPAQTRHGDSWTSVKVPFLISECFRSDRQQMKLMS